MAASFKNEQQNRKALTDYPKLNDRVKTVNGQIGIVRYIGTTSFASGIFIGLELQQWCWNGHDGTVKEKQYFSCRSGRGCFVRLEMLVNNLTSDEYQEEQPAEQAPVPSTPKLKDIDGNTSTNNNEENNGNIRFDREKVRIMARKTCIDWTGKYKDKQVIEVTVDDAVSVANNGTGVVKYFGPVDFLHEEHNVVGILMDQWHPQYGNGTVDGKQYFESEDGRGYFAHPPEILENLGSTKPKVVDDEYTNINSKIEALQRAIDRVEKNLREIELLEQSSGQELDPQMISNVKSYQHTLTEWILQKNQWSLRKKQLQEDIFGVRKRMKSKDQCLVTGYVRTLSELCQQPCVSELVVGIIMWRHYHTFVNPDEWIGKRCVTMNDMVVLRPLSIGHRGKVIFIGNVHFDRRLHFGILLNEWSVHAHNGSVDGISYFVSPAGRGALVPNSCIFSVS